MTTAAKFLFGEEPEDGEESDCPCKAAASKPKVAPSSAFMRELKRMYPMGATVEPIEEDDMATGSTMKPVKLAALLTLLGED